MSQVGKFAFVCIPAALLLGNGIANAGQTIDEVGAFACFTDKWDEKKQEDGTKLVDSAIRCVAIPDDAKLEKVSEACTGKYEYKPDDSWKGTGTCTDTYKEGTVTWTYEEGSHLKGEHPYPYKIISGTGKYKGVTGNGAYSYDNLTDTLSGGRYKETKILP